MNSSNKRKAELLGEPYGTASAKLRKSLLFDFADRLDLLWCFRCQKKIHDIVNFSIDHKTSWATSRDPIKTFFDLENIAFSHLSCNCSAAESYQKSQTHCKRGHLLSGSNIRNTTASTGKRICKECVKINSREVYKTLDKEKIREYDRKYYWEKNREKKLKQVFEYDRNNRSTGVVGNTGVFQTPVSGS